MERMTFATNPEWWRTLYMDPNADEEGKIVFQPGSPDEFREMAEMWGLDPNEIAELGL